MLLHVSTDWRGYTKNSVFSEPLSVEWGLTLCDVVLITRVSVCAGMCTHDVSLITATDGFNQAMIGNPRSSLFAVHEYHGVAPSLCRHWEQSNPLGLHSSPSCHQQSLSHEKYFHMDPLFPETCWQLIVLCIFMLGELFLIRLKMKINCLCVLYGEQVTNLHFLLFLIHLHICLFSGCPCPQTAGLHFFFLVAAV